MRILATFCLSFAIGIFIALYAVQWFCLLILLLLLIVIGALFFTLKKYRHHLILIASGFLFAYLCLLLFTARVVKPCRDLVGSTRVLRIELCDFPQQTDSGVRSTVRIIRNGVDVRAIYYGSEKLLDCRPGDRFAVNVDVSDASTLYGRRVSNYTSEGIWLILYAQQEEIPSVAAKYAVLRYFPLRLRHRVENVIDRAFSQRTAGLMHALVLGDQSRMSDDDSSLLRETGLYHITAVSGLHCAFLIAVVSFFIGRYYSKLLASVSIPLLLLYALVVGAPPSVVRACVMLIFTLIAPIFNREADPITSLSFALFLILIFNPYAIESIGLQLSFASVGGILFLSLPLNRVIVLREYPTPVQIVLQSFSVTAGAMVFTVPLSLLYFDSISLVSPISNFFCIWMASALFICGFVAILLGMIYLPIAASLGVVLNGGVWYLYTVVRWLSRIPYHSVSAYNRYFCVWIVFSYACLILCLVCRKRRILRMVSLCCILCGLAASVLLHTQSFRCRPFTVVALDVGQGSCTILLTPQNAFMIDCGSGNHTKKAGYLASDYLLSAGYRYLDALYLTHFDKDHINGLEEFLSRMKVGTLYIPQGNADDEEFLRILHLAGEHHIKLETITSTKTHTYGQVVVRAFPPIGDDDSNEAGLSFLCKFGTFDLLATGDMNIETEGQLTEYFSEDIEVLLVGHHGSARSTSDALLEATKPEVGIISVGANSYGHPSGETLSRLHQYGVVTHRTDEEGTVTITIDRGQKWQIKATKN